MPELRFTPGDWVIYRKTKRGVKPGPRAQDVHAHSHGDGYSYLIDKCWVVADVRPDATLLLKTRRGKEHVVPIDDPCLRKPNWWQRLRYGSRFKSVEQTLQGKPDPGADK